MIKKLLPFFEKKYWKFTLLSPLTVIGEVILEIYLPFLMAKIIDVGIANTDMVYIKRTGILMIVLACVSLLLGALSGHFASVASTGLSKGLRTGLFNKIQDFSFSNVDKFSTASLVTRITADVNNIQLSFMMIIRILVRAPIMLICSAVMAYRINPSLATIFLIVIPVLALAMIMIGVITFPKFKIMMQKYDIMNRSVQENLIGIRVVKAFVRKTFENKKFINAISDVRKTQIIAESRSITMMPLLMFATYASIIAISWLGGNQIIEGTMFSGEFFSFISYATQILVSMMMIAFIFISVMLSKASLSRVIEIFDEEIDIKDNPESEAELKDGSIVFDNVSFKYEKSSGFALSNISLTINSGETIGIIGGTGSSKTSLVQLIPRLYDVTEGRVLVGGTDVKDYSLKTLRDGVSMVLQNNVLFSGTIEENLKWGNPNATHEQVVEACKSACAHDFIESFPDGYETDLGQGGVNVSGGQKQRLCIARALLKEPKILILDDSTSAVDTATDSSIRAAFRKYHSNTTKIIIAQRVSSISDADRIIVMDNGKINAVGTHEELLEKNDIYKEVYMSQQKGVE